MPISGYFDVVFGVSGTITTVPDAIQIDGSVSYTQGWGPDYTLPASNPSYKYIEQGHFNQIFYDITSAIQNYQQNCYPPFITTAMNGGTPYSYSKYNTVLYGGVAYVSNTNTNTDTPPSSKWNAVPISAGNVFTGGTTTGSANAQVLASLNPASGFSLANNGQVIICRAGFSNTGGAMTLAITSPAVAATSVKIAALGGYIDPPANSVILNEMTAFVVDSVAGVLVIDEGFVGGSFLETANNLSELTGTAATARGNIGAAKSGANTDITSLQGSALVFTPLGIGSPLLAGHAAGTVVAGATVAGSSLSPVEVEMAGASSGVVATGDTLTGTYTASSGYPVANAAYFIIWQRTL